MIKIYHISLLCSVVGIILIIKGQYELGIQFALADGKTQALYGLRTLKELNLIAFGLVALILSIASFLRKENKTASLISLFISIVAIVLPLTELWKLWA